MVDVHRRKEAVPTDNAAERASMAAAAVANLARLANGRILPPVDGARSTRRSRSWLALSAIPSPTTASGSASARDGGVPREQHRVAAIRAKSPMHCMGSHRHIFRDIVAVQPRAHRTRIYFPRVSTLSVGRSDSRNKGSGDHVLRDSGIAGERRQDSAGPSLARSRDPSADRRQAHRSKSIRQSRYDTTDDARFEIVPSRLSTR